MAEKRLRGQAPNFLDCTQSVEIAVPLGESFSTRTVFLFVSVSTEKRKAFRSLHESQAVGFLHGA